MSIEKISAEIENAIGKLGIDPTEARTQNEGQWNISKDQKIQIMLDLWEEKGLLFFQVLTPVCEVGDANNVDFFKLLLSENHGFCEAAFTILDNGVYLKHTSDAEGLTEEKILKLITRIAFYNEVFSEKLN